jgi:hypothetical protein
MSIISYHIHVVIAFNIIIDDRCYALLYRFWLQNNIVVICLFPSPSASLCNVLPISFHRSSRTVRTYMNHNSGHTPSIRSFFHRVTSSSSTPTVATTWKGGDDAFDTKNTKRRMVITDNGVMSTFNNSTLTRVRSSVLLCQPLISMILEYVGGQSIARCHTSTISNVWRDVILRHQSVLYHRISLVAPNYRLFKNPQDDLSSFDIKILTRYSGIITQLSITGYRLSWRTLQCLARLPWPLLQSLSYHQCSLPDRESWPSLVSMGKAAMNSLTRLTLNIIGLSETSIKPNWAHQSLETFNALLIGRSSSTPLHMVINGRTYSDFDCESCASMPSSIPPPDQSWQYQCDICLSCQCDSQFITHDIIMTQCYACEQTLCNDCIILSNSCDACDQRYCYDCVLASQSCHGFDNTLSRQSTARFNDDKQLVLPLSPSSSTETTTTLLSSWPRSKQAKVGWQCADCHRSVCLPCTHSCYTCQRMLCSKCWDTHAIVCVQIHPSMNDCHQF